MHSHIVDENCTDLMKLTLFIDSNSEKQQIIALKILPDVLKNESPSCIQLIFPKLNVKKFESNKKHARLFLELQNFYDFRRLS
jgi:hypothetical protein